MIIKPFNEATQSALPEIEVSYAPAYGASLTIEGDTFFVSELHYKTQSDPTVVGVLPEVVDHPNTIENIERHLSHLKVAGRTITFFSSRRKVLDLVNCDKLKIG